jgi:RNA polymerase sigma-70 factor, ECF subfamily
MENRDSLFQGYVTEHYGTVLKAAHRLAGDRESAEDLTQETFYRAYRAFAAFDSRCRFDVWALKILKRLHIDHVRKRKRTVKTAEFNEGLHRADPTCIESAAMADCLPAEIVECLERLPFAYREVMLLSSLQGLEHAEIARRTGVKPATVRSRLFRAHQWMRQMLADARVAGIMTTVACMA